MGHQPTTTTTTTTSSNNSNDTITTQPTTTTAATATATHQQHPHHRGPHSYHQHQHQQQREPHHRVTFSTFADIQKFRPKLQFEAIAQQQQSNTDHPSSSLTAEQQQKMNIVFLNVKFLSNQINRRPQYIMKYLSHAMKCTCYYHQSKFVGHIHNTCNTDESSMSSIHVSSSSAQQQQQQQQADDHVLMFHDLKSAQGTIQHHLINYVKNYVQCPQCQSIHTSSKMRGNTPLSTVEKMEGDPIMDNEEGESLLLLSSEGFSIHCRSCKANTVLNRDHTDEFLNDIVQSRIRNEERINSQHQQSMMRQKSLGSSRFNHSHSHSHHHHHHKDNHSSVASAATDVHQDEHRLNEINGSAPTSASSAAAATTSSHGWNIGTTGGKYPTHYQNINGAYYFDVVAPPSEHLMMMPPMMAPPPLSSASPLLALSDESTTDKDSEEATNATTTSPTSPLFGVPFLHGMHMMPPPPPHSAGYPGYPMGMPMPHHIPPPSSMHHPIHAHHHHHMHHAAHHHPHHAHPHHVPSPHHAHHPHSPMTPVSPPASLHHPHHPHHPILYHTGSLNFDAQQEGDQVMMSIDAIEKELFEQQQTKSASTKEEEEHVESDDAPVSQVVETEVLSSDDKVVDSDDQKQTLNNRSNKAANKKKLSAKKQEKQFVGDSDKQPTRKVLKKKFVALSSSGATEEGSTTSGGDMNSSHNGDSNNNNNGGSSNDNFNNPSRFKIWTPSEIEEQYKAAGVLPFTIHPTTKKLMFLMGKEVRGKDRIASWSEFGGKRDRTDRDSIHTAAREFCEETVAVFQKGGCISNVNASSLEQSIAYIEGLLRGLTEEQLKNQSTYYPGGKYRFFLMQMPYVDEEVLMQATKVNTESRFVNSTEKEAFKWVEADHLYSIVCDSKRPNPKERSKELLYLEPDEVISSFFRSMFRSSRYLVRKLISSHKKPVLDNKK